MSAKNLWRKTSVTAPGTKRIVCGGHTNGVLVFFPFDSPNTKLSAERCGVDMKCCDYKYCQLLIIRLNGIVVRWFRILIAWQRECMKGFNHSVYFKMPWPWVDATPMPKRSCLSISFGHRIYSETSSMVFLLLQSNLTSWDCIRLVFLFHQPSHWCRTSWVFGISKFGPISPMAIILFASSN